MERKIDLPIILADVEYSPKELNTSFLNQALSSFEQYQKTGEHLTGKKLLIFSAAANRAISLNATNEYEVKSVKAFSALYELFSQ